MNRTDQEQPRVIDASGEFHVEDEPIDLSRYRLEDWLAFVIFWALAVVVFYQFFTRYALNDSASWTEEIARYLLIGVAFVGAAINVRKNNHIQVDFFYKFMPKWMSRAFSTFVDGIRVVFLGYCVGLTMALVEKIGSQRMAIIDWPIGVLYAFVAAGFLVMTWRALDVAVANWRRGASVLERPELADDEAAMAPAPGGLAHDAVSLALLGAVALAVWGAGLASPMLKQPYVQGIECVVLICLAYAAFRAVGNRRVNR